MRDYGGETDMDGAAARHEAMRGYRALEVTAAVIDADGWFNTDDLVRFDGDILYIVGRTEELIIRSGFNVYCRPFRPAKSSSTGSPRSLVTGISRTLLVIPAQAGI